MIRAAAEGVKIPSLALSPRVPPGPQVLTAALVPICFPVAVGARGWPGKGSFHPDPPGP